MEDLEESFQQYGLEPLEMGKGVREKKEKKEKNKRK